MAGTRFVWERERKIRDTRRRSICRLRGTTAVVECYDQRWVATVTTGGETITSPHFTFRIQAMGWAEQQLAEHLDEA